MVFAIYSRVKLYNATHVGNLIDVLHLGLTPQVFEQQPTPDFQAHTELQRCQQELCSRRHAETSMYYIAKTRQPRTSCQKRMSSLCRGARRRRKELAETLQDMRQRLVLEKTSLSASDLNSLKLCSKT